MSQREYYGLYAFFDDGEEITMPYPKSREAMASHRRDMETHERKVRELEAALESAKAGHEADRQETQELSQALAALKNNRPEPPTDPVRVMGRKARETRVLRRGDFLQPSDAVEAGGLQVLPVLSGGLERDPDRRDLARWLMSEENPLTPRVLANQVWEKLFGQGLVRTMNDFGVRGEAPTHPALLDWLASEYRRLGWSRKRLIKTIVLSVTYRQSSAHREDLRERDPENHWLARQNRFRVEAEIVRDLSLAVAGLLSGRIGGPSVFPPMPPEIAALSYANSFKWENSEGSARYRRGMYTYFQTYGTASQLGGL